MPMRPLRDIVIFPHMVVNLVYKLAKGNLMKARSFRILCLVNEQLVILDVREEIEYCSAEGHIPGALNYPWISGVLQELYVGALHH